ncbi:transglutaminase family protein [Candidatus Latescibacterota bacterium]
MRKRSPIILAFTLSLIAWLGSMGTLAYEFIIRGRVNEQALVSSDIAFNTEERFFYTIHWNGQKVGYRSESWIPQPHMYLIVETNVLKMNLAGMSREVFLQSVTAIDSISLISRNMSFTLGSGSHSYAFDGAVSGDSLNIKVKKNSLDPVRSGAFLVNEAITYPSALPFYLHQTKTETMSLQVFDPIIFNEYLFYAEREGNEIRTIDGSQVILTRFDTLYNEIRGFYLLDTQGHLMRAEGYPLFGGLLGDFVVEKASGQAVFMLPLEVTFGNNIFRDLVIVPDLRIQNPRAASVMEVELDGIRAANIDLGDTHKEYVSANPVIFRIHDEPVMTGDRLRYEREIAGADTAITGSSDYIQPLDARIIRAAREAVGAETDTLAMAYAIRRWVSDTMQPLEGLDLIRSVDILRERKGACDEYTKLFTALTRSIGIPTQIYLGLVYRDGVFRYHSWPAVFTGGTWHALDPYFAQDQADATHITLIRGDFERLVDLLRIVGLISIHIRGVR